MKKPKKRAALSVVNPHAAGIDVGSRSHFVAVGQDDDQVREFGVYSEDLDQLAHWLKEQKVDTIAMESTGNYWQTLFAGLQERGFEVLLVNGKFTKNMRGRKTDIQDCQWIQQLHTMGLLSSCFLPDAVTEQIRTFTRHRFNLVQMAASTQKKMQKYLRLLNLRLDVVIKDICGESGMRIIKAVIDDEKDGEKLSELADYRVKKSREEIAKALQNNGRMDYHFALGQEYQTYLHLQEQISRCDEALKDILEKHRPPDTDDLEAPKKPFKKVNKNTPKNIDINQIAYRYFNGVDLMAIEGMSHATVLSIISEIGPDGFKKFPTAKHFTSWLRLSPNNKISGGKILSNHTPKGSTRLKIALRQAANATGNLKDTHLSGFFRRICFKRGRSSAVTATVRKLAVIIWNMVVNQMPYNPPSAYEFLDQKRKRKVIEIRKALAKFDIKHDEIGLQIA